MDTEAKKIIIEQGNKIETLEDIVLSECKGIIEKHKINESVIREIITTSLEPVQEFSRALWRLYNATCQNCPNIFSILDAKLFLRIIKHIRNIVYQKIENRNVGISIIVFSNSTEVDGRFYDVQPISIDRYTKTKDTKKFFEDQQNKLKRAYKGVDSKKAFFAFSYDKANETLIFKGIRTFDSSFEDVCRNNAVGFNVSEGVPCIRIYHQHRHILDYIISESTGDWVIRIKDAIRDIIEKQIDGLHTTDLEILTQIVMQLSYLRIGAMLIITKSPEKFRDKIESHKLLRDDALLEDYFRNGLIYQYAAADGAVVIQFSVGARLRLCNNGVVLNPQGKGYSKEYDNLISKSNCGTRHEKAARHSCENPDDCLFVVSENRSISILHGPNPIYWRDDSNPLKSKSNRKIQTTGVK